MSLNASTKRTFISRLLCGATALSRRQPWLLAVRFRCLPGSWRPQLSLGHVYWGACFLSPLTRLQDMDGTKRVVTDHQWSQFCSRIMVALATSLAELTPANIEWMTGSTAQIKRGLCNYLRNPWQRSPLPRHFPNILIFKTSKWRFFKISCKQTHKQKPVTLEI